MNSGLTVGGAMPAWLLYPASLLAIAILVYPFYRTRNVISRFALFALCFRYLASAHHAITFQLSPIGMSWNAIGSSGLFLTGTLLVRRRHFLLKPLIPCYAMIG